MNETDMEERITELETKVMFQDQTIEELNQVIYDQQQQLDKLGDEVALLKKQLAALNQMLQEGEASAP